MNFIQKYAVSLLVFMMALYADAWYDTEMVNGVTWRFTVQNGEAKIGYDEVNGAIEDYGGTSLPKDVVIPAVLGGCPVTAIGPQAFSNYYDPDANYESPFTSIVIPDSVKDIGTNAFSSCNNLTNLVMSTGVTNICEGAFSGCRSLVSINIPDGVLTIGNRAFWWCSGLTNMTIPASVTRIGWGLFAGCTGLKTIEVAKGNSAYVYKDGLLLTKDETHIVQRVESDGKLPATVTSIGNSSFAICSNLTNVTIPVGVTNIANNAFAACVGLESFEVDSDNPFYKSYSGLLLSKDGEKLVCHPREEEPDLLHRC